MTHTAPHLLDCIIKAQCCWLLAAQNCDLQQRFGERVVGSTKPVHNHTGELTVQPQSSIGDCFAVLKLSEVKCLTHR